MTPVDPALSASSLPFSRRALVGSSLAAATVWRLGTSPVLGARQEGPSDRKTWRTWLLKAVDELRPAAPADPASSEMDELLDYQSRRADETAAIVTKWGSRPAVIPWVEIGLDLSGEFGFSGPRTSRAQALLRTALYDTVLANLDAQEAYPREMPSVANPRLTPMEGVDTNAPSFPSLHAAVAGAAGAVLPYLFPDAEAGRFEPLVEEAATSR